MFNMFNEIDIINNLKTIIKAMEENEENKMMLHAFILETQKYPIRCDCKQGLERLKCEKCKGTGYCLVAKKDSD